MPRGFVSRFQPGFALTLVLVTTLCPHLIAKSASGVHTSDFNGQVVGLRTIRIVPSQNRAPSYGTSKLAFDQQFAYLATPDGLFRTAPTLAAEVPLTFIGFAGQRIYNLYVHNDVLYVLKEGGDPRNNSLDAHSFLKSTDRGQTFVPLDEGLTWCHGDYCEYLHATHAFFKDDLIFLAAGGAGNFFVTPDEGKNWIVLSGSLEPMVCSDAAIEMIGNKVLMGLECPLDSASIYTGTLRSDMRDWAESGRLRQVIGPKELEGRHVQFIEHSLNTSYVFAGVEGGVLRSDDLGDSYQFKIMFPMSGPSQYPYVHQILIPALFRDLVIVGGWDKPRQAGYLAYSKDHGETFTDISELVRAPEFAALDVVFLSQAPDGRALIGLNALDEKTLTIAEVLIAARPELLTEGDQNRALALDSVTLVREPFSPFNQHNFGAEGRTRISLFCSNLQLAPNESISAVTVQAEDSQHWVYQLPVESVVRTPGFPWLATVVVKLPDILANLGDVQISISVKGVESNKALLSLQSAAGSSP